MAEYYNIVPWSNSKEWFDVCDKLHPTTTLTHKKEALEKLMVWKARCPFLPSGIESTLTLLEIIVKDASTPDTSDAAIDQVLRLSYSTAIMRFINHMFDGETAKGSSLYQAAINLNVPSWIVDLRHDTAHSNTLPTLQLLRDAAEISCGWLYEQYWLKHKPFICDYITHRKVVVEENEYKLGTLMNFCVSLGVCMHAESKIKNLADIPNAHIQESILNDAHEIFGNAIDLSQLKTTAILSLINLITAQSKKLLQGKNTASYINKALLGDDSLILSLELLKQLDNRAIKKRCLRTVYVQCFEVLLTLLHTNNLLQDFILDLIQLTQKDIDHNKCTLAALWIAEILNGLKKSRDFTDKMKNVTQDNSPKKKNDLRSLYHHWFPNDKIGLFLDLEKSIPHNLTDIHFIQTLISSYNPYLTYFIRNLLHLVQPKLPEAVINNICKLADLIAFPNNFPSISSSKIYTTDDLKIHKPHHPKIEVVKSDVTVLEPCEDNNKNEDLPGKSLKNSIWKPTIRNSIWKLCPIGKVPRQESTTSNSTIAMDIS